MSRVLVVGALLLDVTGHASPGQGGVDDRIGHARLSLGGVALNVAANLDELGREVDLFTCLKHQSPVSDLIRDFIRQMRLGVQHIYMEPVEIEPLFLGIFEENEFESAVTSSPIESIDLDRGGRLEAAIRRASVVVVDTNLSADQIVSVSALCRRSKVKLVVVSASDAKAVRISDAARQGASFYMVSMNRAEAASLDIGLEPDGDPSSARKRLSCDCMLLSAGKHGAEFVDAEGVHKLDPPAVGVVNSVGAGDALLAATLHVLMSDNHPSAPRSRSEINSTVAKVLTMSASNLRGPLVYGERKRSQFTEYTALILILALFFMALASGFVFGVSSVPGHWISIFAAALTGGALGASLDFFRRRTGVAADEPLSADLLRFGALGGAAGLVVALVSSIPATVGGGLLSSESFDLSERYAHLIVSSALAILAGAAYRRTVLSMTGSILR
jgi:pseudouridine kinase